MHQPLDLTHVRLKPTLLTPSGRLVTNAAGAYTRPPLVLGTYTVKVELARLQDRRERSIYSAAVSRSVTTWPTASTRSGGDKRLVPND